MSRNTPDPDHSDPDHSDTDHSDPDRIGTDPASRRGATTGPPRWVKIFGIIAVAVLLLLVVVGLFTGGHGPGRHTTGLDGATPPSRTALSVHQP